MMKDLITVTGLVALVALSLFLAQRHQGRPPSHDTHTGILKNSVYDCAVQDRRNLQCDEMKQ